MEDRTPYHVMTWRAGACEWQTTGLFSDLDAATLFCEARSTAYPNTPNIIMAFGNIIEPSVLRAARLTATRKIASPRSFGSNGPIDVYEEECTRG